MEKAFLQNYTPNLFRLSNFMPQMCNKKREHVSFDKDCDNEIIRLVFYFKNDTRAVWNLIKKGTSPSFEKKCRDRYNNSINKHTFTQDEDDLIFKMRSENKMAWRIIAKKINGTNSKQIQNRFKTIKREYEYRELQSGTTFQTGPIQQTTTCPFQQVAFYQYEQNAEFLMQQNSEQSEEAIF